MSAYPKRYSARLPTHIGDFACVELLRRLPFARCSAAKHKLLARNNKTWMLCSANAFGSADATSFRG
jgi:hypothetical protein